MAGQSTFEILLLNDANMIGEYQETRMKMPNMCPLEKTEKALCTVFMYLGTFNDVKF